MLPTKPQQPTALPRSSQIGMAVVLTLLAGTLLLRGYVTATPTPLQQQPGSIAYRIDVNRATEAELQLLPGVGPTLAEKIHAHRGVHGPFQSVEELDAVPGVGANTINSLKPWVETSPSKPLLSSSLDVDRLERKPPPPAVPIWSAGTPKLQPGEGVIDVNAASESDLLRLPGVGPTLARRIIVERGLQRFIDVNDMRRVQGIGGKTLEKIRPFVAVTK